MKLVRHIPARRQGQELHNTIGVLVLLFGAALVLLTLFLTFFHPLVFVIPLVFLNTFILTIGVYFIISKKFFRKNWRMLITIAAILLSLIIFIDLASHYFVHHPVMVTRMPTVLKSIIIYDYMVDRKLIQYETGMAEHNPHTSYRLKPGNFTFSNVEFNNKFIVNSQGFRDDEESLKKPDILVLGDSVAMGWGVEQNETFAQQIEMLTRKKVLNTAVSSYGTARELITLTQQDLENVKTVIIQYHDNDFGENKHYSDHGEKLIISTQKQYEREKWQLKMKQAYFPGKYTLLMFNYFLDQIKIFNKESDDYELHAKYFFNVLAANRRQLEGKQIILIILDNAKLTASFNDYVLQEKSLQEFIINIEIVNIDGVYNYAYTLDGHFRPAGQRLIAEKIFPLLKQ